MNIKKNPVYDEDYVTLGYLKEYIESPDNDLSKVYSKNFGTQPKPPYHVNDTWTDMDGKFYVCIKDRLIGNFNISDWVLIIDKQPYDKLVAEYGDVTIDMLASQVYDHKIESFVQTTDPSLDWITYIDRELHVYDFWKNPATNKEYVYIRKDTNPITYEWEPRMGSSIIWNSTTGHKNIFNTKPDIYNESDLWLIGEITLPENIPDNANVGDWVFASQDSDAYDKSHWSEALIDIDLTIVETKVYSRVEVDNRLTILENETNVKLATTENSILGQVSSTYATKHSVTKLDSNLGLIENRVTTTEDNINLLEITSDRTINTISSVNKTVLGTATYGVTQDTVFKEGIDYYILVDDHYEMLAPGTDYNIGDNISDFGSIVYNATFHGGLTEEVDGYSEKIHTLEVSVSELDSRISEVADITTSAETIVGTIDEIDKVNAGEPINIKIHPIITNISNLLISNDMLISSNFKLKNRILRFTNKTTGEIFDWEIPTDLWYYDADNWDELVLTYEPRVVTVTRKCKVNSYGVVELLSIPQTETYSYPDKDLILTDGDYSVSLVGYNSAYLFVRLIASNIYTTQFYTKAETDTRINQSATDVTIAVDQKLTGYTTTEQAQSLINVSAEGVLTKVGKEYTTKTEFGTETKKLETKIKSTAAYIELVATDNKTSAGITIKLKNEDGTELESAQANITLSGLVKFTDLSNEGSTTINGSNIKTGTIDASVVKVTNLNADNIKSGTINGTNVNITNLNASNITGGTLSADKINGGSISASAINLGNGVFKVETSGVLVATSATITGTIRATSGYIGSSGSGWNISSSYIYRGGTGGSNGARLYADGRLYMKNDYGWINTGSGGSFINGNTVWLSDNVGKQSVNDSNATIELSALYGNIRIASNNSIVLQGSSIYVGNYKCKSDYIDVRDADGTTKLRLQFVNGLYTGYTKL